jgi:uncharacterized protein
VHSRKPYGRMTAMSMTGRLVTTLLCGALLSPSVASGADRDLRVVEAARGRNGTALLVLLKQKADPNAPQADGATALHWAAHWNDLNVVDALIRAGARVDAANDYGVRPLNLAATNGSASVIERLIKAGASVNTALPTGETPLMTAARTGKIEAVAALLANNADVNAKESVMGQSALMWAISEGHVPVARVLLDRGADVKAASKSGFTPLLFAVREGNLEAVKMLVANGSDVNEAAADGNSALHVAVVRGHVDVAMFLLERRANANASGPGYTPLHWVAGTWESIHTHDYIFNPTAVNTVKEWSVLAGVPSQAEKHALIKALLAGGADINAKMTKAPPRYGFTLFKTNYIVGATPLYLAAQAADVPTMKLLLTNGANATVSANDNTTLLIVAAGMARVDTESMIPESRHIEAVKLALDLGHDVKATNNAGNTALHAATMAGFNDLVQLLIEKGALINARNKKGETSLKLANGYELDAMLYTRPTTAALLKTLGGME